MFSFISCLEACRHLARRYVALRPTLPVGFFLNRVVDVQAFSAAVFLLLASCRTTRGYSAGTQTINYGLAKILIDQAVKTLQCAAEWTGGDFARQAAGAIHSLRSLLQQPQASASQSLTLSLPLIGTLHVSRREQAAKGHINPPDLFPSQSALGNWQTAASEASHPSAPTMPSGFADSGMMDSF